MSIVSNTLSLVDHSAVKVWILTLPYKSNPNLGQIFSDL